MGTPRRIRLDILVVDRGLAETRSRAQALILAGRVRVNNSMASKTGLQVSIDADVQLSERDHPFVGRGALKLTHAFDQFDIDIRGRTALDIGASTGGFTDVMLHRNARHVVALDVGRGQLDWRLRNDSRVTVMEGTNARYLTPDDFPVSLRAFSCITIDVSFISLKLILPVLPPLLAANSDIAALVKPQFEAGRSEVGKGGIVRDPIIHARVVEEVIAAADTLGLRHMSTTASPILGAEGNREFFLHLRDRNRTKPDA
ncbi:MAG TPA: TlyA family RNA methyltransferase [Acidobacteria bacterium]|nr:TlyA family RNA methyltransferase [Acidobacteriota bacterium]